MVLLGVKTDKVATHHESLSASVVLPTLNADNTVLPFTLAINLGVGGTMMPV